MTRVRRIYKKQIFLPEFVLTLLRTPFLPPRYASFYVPLEFNKLDMREYMRRVYNVDVISIRSYVEQQKVTRDRRDGKLGYGPLRRPRSKKKMTIEMTEPFAWPEVPQDLSPWQKDQFYSHYKYNKEVQEANQPSASAKPRKNEAKSFEEQAKALMEGKETWKPTWQVLGLRYDRPGLAKFSMKPQVKTAKPTESTTESSEIIGSTDHASSPSSKDA